MQAILLRQIAAQLYGTYLADLTKAEHEIATVLLQAGYLYVDQFYTLQRR